MSLSLFVILIASAWVAADPPEVVPEPTAEDLRAIEEALAADKAARAPVPPPAPAPVAPVPRFNFALNPDISLILDAAAAVFSTDEPLQTGAHDPSRTGFNLQQLELNVSHAVDPYFRFDSYIVFTQNGVHVEEAYATTLTLPGNLQVRGGQFLTRFGRLNPTHPHAWDFADQPFMWGRVWGGEGNRGLGAEVSWLAPLPWFAELVASSTQAGGEATARSFYGPNDLGVRAPWDLQSTLALKQFFGLSQDLSLMWGLSAAHGPNGTGYGNDTAVYGTDLYLRYRPATYASFTVVSLQVEWLYRRRQIPRDLLWDHGGYAYLLWQFARRWSTGLRWEYGSPSYDLGGDVRADDLDPEWTRARDRTTAQLTFRPSEFSRLRLQGGVDRPRWLSEPNWVALLAVEFVTGAHGAHNF